MKKILVLTLFQCITGDFFTSKNFDTGTNDVLVKTPFTECHIQIILIENSVIVTKTWNRTSIFLQSFFKPMKQIVVLTLFQCITGDFFTSKNFDTGTNDVLVKTPFTECHTDHFD